MRYNLKKYSAIYLPFGKADDTPSPSLPRAPGSKLQLHPRTPWILGILDFRSIRLVQTVIGFPEMPLFPRFSEWVLKKRRKKECTYIREAKFLQSSFYPIYFQRSEYFNLIVSNVYYQHFENKHNNFCPDVNVTFQLPISTMKFVVAGSVTLLSLSESRASNMARTFLV